MGIDAARRIFTGRTLRGMISGLISWFSIGLMLYYNLTLGLTAIVLTAVRAAMIIATSAIRLYNENKHFDLQGKIAGFVLQLIAGKPLPVSPMPPSLARSQCGRRNSRIRKRYFIASQRAANALGAFEASFPTIATLAIFATASYTNNNLLTDIGGFLAFFTRLRSIDGIDRCMGIERR